MNSFSTLLRLLLIAYSVACLMMMGRMLGVILAGDKRSVKEVITIFLFPLFMLSPQGRAELASIFNRRYIPPRPPGRTIKKKP